MRIANSSPDSPRIVKYLKTAAAKRQVDLHHEIAEYLQRYAAGKSGLLFHTANGTPHLYGNLEDRWFTPRLTKMELDEVGMGWHSFKRFRKTWLRGARYFGRPEQLLDGAQAAYYV
jgi:hypothetical protein